MTAIFDLIRARQSVRVPFDPARKVGVDQLQRILDAAAWAPTAHNMQNFEVLVVDDARLLAAIGAITTQPTSAFIRENFALLSFSADQLRCRRTGVLASGFPPAWRTLDGDFESVAARSEPLPLSRSLQGAPCLLLVLYDPHRRAPDSEGDTLGLISLGCVMQNIWLAAQATGISMQILSVLSTPAAEAQLRRMLEIPVRLQIAYSCRLGYPVEPAHYERVRRPIGEFTSHNGYHRRGLAC
jgi:nitroreductase